MANYMSMNEAVREEAKVNLYENPRTLKQISADMNSKMCSAMDMACTLFKTITGVEFELTKLPMCGDSAMGAFENLDARLEEILCILDRTIGAIG